MFRSCDISKTEVVQCGRALVSNPVCVCVCVGVNRSCLACSLVSLSCWISVAYGPDSLVDIKATFAPRETGSGHLFVCASGYTVCLLGHSGLLCFNTGWMLHSGPDLSTLIHFLICLVTMRNPTECVWCTWCEWGHNKEHGYINS